MKKLPTILLASSLFLATCGNNSHSDDNSNKDKQSQSSKGDNKATLQKQLKNMKSIQMVNLINSWMELKNLLRL